MQNLKLLCFIKGLKDGIPILLGYFAVSFTFGIAAVKGGLTPFEAAFMSGTNLTSAGQFAGLPIVKGPYLELAATQLVINLRYLLMSASLSQKISPKTGVASRLLMSFGMTDEIFGVSYSCKGRIRPQYVYGLICAAWPGWTFGTLAGATLNGLLPQDVISAFSLALYGMFLAVIIPPARKSRPLLGVIIASMALSSLFYLAPVFSFVGSGFKIIILTCTVAAVFAVLYPVRENGYDG